MSSIAPLASGTIPALVDKQNELGGKAAALLNEYIYRLLRSPRITGFHLTPLEVDQLLALISEYQAVAGPHAELTLEISLLDLIRIYTHQNP